MRKVLLVLFVALLAVSCEKEEENKFDYDLKLLHGTWRITEVKQNDGTFFDVTTTLGQSAFEPTYATFNADGTYHGSGYFGDGTGIYTAEGKKITTFIDGVELFSYTVVSLSGTECHLIMSGGSSSNEIKCKKQ